MGRLRALQLLFLEAVMLTSSLARQPVSSSCTKRFGDGLSPRDTTVSHWCEEECTAWKDAPYSQKPTGSLAYDQYSPICLSAVHAGVLTAGQQATVSYKAVAPPSDFQGTIRNRVQSDFKRLVRNEPAFSFVDQSNHQIPDGALTGVEIIMAHNNIHQYFYRDSYSRRDIALFVTCMPSRKGQSLPHQNFRRWDLRQFKPNGKDVVIETDSFSIYTQTRAIQNSRVLRCLSDNPRLDVVGIFGRMNDDYVPQSPTVTKNKGENFTWSTPAVPWSVAVNRLPNTPWPISASFTNLSVQDTGLYSFTKKGSSYSSYAQLIVRDCPRDRYGPDCRRWCPDCRNSGECHPLTGQCVCAPGTFGDRCQHFCPEGQYGFDCQLDCTAQHIKWAQGNVCKNITFCTHEPRGCACHPGFQPPACDDECKEGLYGPDCLLPCLYCIGNSCAPHNGRCLEGCLDGSLCDANHMPLDLPRFLTPPQVEATSYGRFTVVLRPWSATADEGTLKRGSTVTGYKVQVQQVDDPTVISTYEVSPPGAAGLRYNFIPGTSYHVRALVDTSSGSADPAYNLRIPQTRLDILCLNDQTYEKANLFAESVTVNRFSIAGVNAEFCGGPEYEFVIKEYSNGREVLRRKTNEVKPIAGNLRANTTYVASVSSATVTVTTLPLPPTVLNLAVQAEATHARATWSSQRAQNFTVSWRKRKNEGCPREQDFPWNDKIETNDHSFLSPLEAFTQYELRVAAHNRGGDSEAICKKFATNPNREPSLQLRNLECRHQSYPPSASCTIHLVGNCSDFRGPRVTLNWTMKGAPSCNTTAVSSFQMAQNLENWNVKSLTHSFDKLTPYVTYNVSVTIENALGVGSTLQKTHLVPASSRPAPVVDLHATATPNSITLYWKPPCPPLGEITHYTVKIYGGSDERVASSQCPNNEGVFCYTVEGLGPNYKYYLTVLSCTQSACSSEERVDIVTKETAPAPPSFSVEEKETGFTIAFAPPMSTTTIAFCTIEAYHGSELSRTAAVDFSDMSHGVEIQGLAKRTVYQLSAYCSNDVGPSRRTNKTRATLLGRPEVLQEPYIRETTSTIATLVLPRIEAGESSVTYTVMVHNVSLAADPVDFMSEFEAWEIKQRNSEGRRQRRQSSSANCDTDQKVYIAGQLTEGENEFVIGSGEASEGMSNCPLVAGNAYDVGVVAVSRLAGQEDRTVLQLPQPFVAGAGGGLSAGASAGISIFLILLVVALIFVLYLQRRGPAKAGLLGPEEKDLKPSPDRKRHLAIHPKKIATTPELRKPPPSQPEHVPLETVDRQATTPKNARNSIPGNDNGGQTTPAKIAPFGKPVLKVKPVASAGDGALIYENQDNAATRTAKPVKLADMEAHLNECIGSAEVLRQFSAVPTNVEKPMTDGENQQNRHKNRYRNNLPYNDTRVCLKIINGDPNSDYINASHIKGACSTRRYIASQGPKDANLCTISDFWRMVVEQEVNVIIMVANFTEKNVVKVGKYFSYDGRVELPELDGSVTLVSTETTAYCTISKLQVEVSYEGTRETRRVSHYHFTKWPDHGVPLETLTLSQMLKRIATSHDTLHAVVHCSAGIGRTGTVIYDLVCYDYLKFHGQVDLMQVLQDLRVSRARLVENQMQFKLCLQLLDEMLFGFQTVIEANELGGCLQSMVQECQTWFQRLNKLPSSLAFSTASWKENLPHNRSSNVLPADSHRIFVQSTSGQQQYINAIRIDSLQGSETYIVAEHPLVGRLEPFWNMVLSKHCPSVVILNAQYDKDFPEIFAKDGSELVAGTVKVKALAQANMGSDLVAHNLSVSNGKMSASVTCYEVEGWERGASCPPDITCLVRLVDALHSTTGPPALVCGDGVTACGLAVGVLRVVERVKEKHDIDVYRTAVKLRRCRKQFFVDETQLQQMLHAAQLYLSEFQDYGNFK